MKKNLIILAIVLSTLLAISATQQRPACCGQNIIRVKGEGEARVIPDLAKIYVSLVEDGTTATQALKNLNTTLNAIYNVLQVNGVSKNDVQTSYVDIISRYNYSGQVPVLIGYRIYLSIYITIPGIDKNPAKFTTIIDALSTIEFNVLIGITYDTSDPYAGKAQARKNAWNDAVSKAKQYAALSGRKLGKVLLIDETSSNIYSISNNNQAINLTATAIQKKGQKPVGLSISKSALQLPPGSISTFVQTIITWQLL